MRRPIATRAPRKSIPSPSPLVSLSDSSDTDLGRASDPSEASSSDSEASHASAGDAEVITALDRLKTKERKSKVGGGIRKSPNHTHACMHLA